MAMLLFSIVIYASLSLVSSTSGALARTMAEYESRRECYCCSGKWPKARARMPAIWRLATSFRPGNGRFCGCVRVRV